MANHRLEISCKISPNRLIDEGKICKIEIYDKDLEITQVIIHLNESNAIQEIEVPTPHPNVHPQTHLLCLPPFLKGKILDKETWEHIKHTLNTFNFDEAYFLPWGGISLKGPIDADRTEVYTTRTQKSRYLSYR